jgi:hypothetical protein
LRQWIVLSKVMSKVLSKASHAPCQSILRLLNSIYALVNN